MGDYFAVLSETRRPWLDAESLKRKFLEASARVHPDHVHHLGETERNAAQERCTELNAAYNCLREPKDRLRHLLELELGAMPNEVQRISSELMDLSLAVGGLCREADAFLSAKAKVTSPLLKVQIFEQAQEWTGKLQATERKINSENDHVLERLKQVDAEWTGPNARQNRDELLVELETISRLLSYFARWNGQIRERIVRLAF